MDEDSEENLERILLMGLAEAGKTTICSQIFEGQKLGEITKYDPTLNYNRFYYSGYPEKKIEVIDTGGQAPFFNIFFERNEEFIFSNIKILIWIVDCVNYLDDKNKELFEKAINSLRKYSPNSEIYCFFHKTDLIDQGSKTSYIENLKTDFDFGGEFKIIFFATSIFDNSLPIIHEKLNIKKLLRNEI